MNIKLLPINFDITALSASLDSHPTLWNQNPQRTQDKTGPHGFVDDIWIRYYDPNNPPNPYQAFPIQWYDLPIISEVQTICDELTGFVGGQELGGVLITRIPSGACVKVHNDRGPWHANTFSKYIVTVRGNKYQSFVYPDTQESLSTHPGQAFWFDNHSNHCVYNCGYDDRISLIICIKTAQGIHLP